MFSPIVAIALVMSSPIVWSVSRKGCSVSTTC